MTAGATATSQARAALALLELGDEERPELSAVPDEELGLPETQKGPQTVAALSKAMITIYGGEAGGGKSFLGVRQAMADHRNPLMSSLILRRTTKQNDIPGGLVDEAQLMYAPYGMKRSGKRFNFPSGGNVTIDGCHHEKSKHDYDGAQPSRIFFDQVEQFTESMFWYIALSRSRSKMGGSTSVLASANPVPSTHKVGGWLSRMLKAGGWVDEKTGLAIEEMSGVMRYWVRIRGAMHFFDTEAEALQAFPDSYPRTMMFVKARLEDNPLGMDNNPEYMGNLEALPYEERMRLRGGNWNVSSLGGGLFKREWVKILAYDPGASAMNQAVDESAYSSVCRGWDLAATTAEEGAKDRTAGVKIGRLSSTGIIVLRDCIADTLSPAYVKELIARTMVTDGPHCTVRLAQDPGQAGKAQAADLVVFLREYAAAAGVAPPQIVVKTITGDKYTRGAGFAAAAEPVQVTAANEIAMFGNVAAVQCDQLDDCLGELHHFDNDDGTADDFWDAAADAYDEVITGRRRITSSVAH